MPTFGQRRCYELGNVAPAQPDWRSEGGLAIHELHSPGREVASHRGCEDNRLPHRRRICRGDNSRSRGQTSPLTRSDPPDPIAARFREPQAAVGADCDVVRSRASTDAVAELGDDAVWSNPPDPVTGAEVVAAFGEPDVAIGACGNAAGESAT